MLQDVEVMANVPVPNQWENRVQPDRSARPLRSLNSRVRSLVFCSDRILTCRIKSIRSPAKVGLVVTDLITSPVVSWEGWETPPPPPSTEAQLSFFAQPPAW